MRTVVFAPLASLPVARRAPAQVSSREKATDGGCCARGVSALSGRVGRVGVRQPRHVARRRGRAVAAGGQPLRLIREPSAGSPRAARARSLVTKDLSSNLSPSSIFQLGSSSPGDLVALRIDRFSTGYEPDIKYRSFLQNVTAGYPVNAGYWKGWISDR